MVQTLRDPGERCQIFLALPKIRMMKADVTAGGLDSRRRPRRVRCRKITSVAHWEG